MSQEGLASPCELHGRATRPVLPTSRGESELLRIDRATLLPETVGAAVAGKSLFYPNSGSDLLTPIRVFAPYVSDFWFSDWRYFRLSEPADLASPVLPSGSEYRLLTIDIKGEPAADPESRRDDKGRSYWWISPARLTETYEHEPSGRVFRVHRRRGFSYTAFVTEDIDLGVFFYRRDSNEGGGPRGGTLGGAWLTNLNYRQCPRRFLGEVLDRLANRGLIVTDGVRMENDETRAIYGALRQFTSLSTTVSGRRALEASRPFLDLEDRFFAPVGYTTKGYGPTLVWQVSRPSA